MEVFKVHDTMEEVAKCLYEIPPAMERLAIRVHLTILVKVEGDRYKVAGVE